MLKLETKEDLQRLVDEGLEESLVLEYKSSDALTRDSSAMNELCKDVSAVANSAGGQIIYGIEEDKATRKPARVDDGVADQKITRDWIDQVLSSRIQPPMDRVRIGRISLGTGRFAYVIAVPATQSGPHQAPDRKYYKRSDLRSVAMQDYEIRDVMQRSAMPRVERAYIYGGANYQVVRTGNGERLELLVKINNYGKTPAFIGTVAASICPQEEIDDPFDWQVQQWKGWVLPAPTPDASAQVALPFVRFGDVIVGRIWYRDIFNACHSSGFVLRLNPDGLPAVGGYEHWEDRAETDLGPAEP